MCQVGGNTPNPKIPIGPHYQVHLAKIMKENTDMVIRTVDMITDPIRANDILEDQDADMIAIARHSYQIQDGYGKLQGHYNIIYQCHLNTLEDFN